MDSMDLEVLLASQRWIAQGLRCELVTVISTWGSSPRPEGAMLALCENGAVLGSVSGGCIEDDLITRAQSDCLRRVTPEVVTYGISADEAHRFGLPCGGTMRLAIEPLSAASGLDELLTLLAQRRLVARTVNMQTGAVKLESALPGMQLSLRGAWLTTIHGPRWRLLIIGAGQLSCFLARIAVGMDYQVTLCDPRVEYTNSLQLDGVDIVHTMPDDAVTDMKPDERSAVPALTHDPKLDDLALLEALRSDAFYVGAIGSRANNRRRRERLQLFDLTLEQVARLRGPVGLYIGSKAPSEIAIAILAELTAVKNGVAIPEAFRIEHAKAALQQAAQPALPEKIGD